MILSQSIILRRELQMEQISRIIGFLKEIVHKNQLIQVINTAKFKCWSRLSTKINEMEGIGQLMKLNLSLGQI